MELNQLLGSITLTVKASSSSPAEGGTPASASKEARAPVPPEARTSTKRHAADRRLVRTRTFSKAHGMAGGRVGYAIGHAEVVAILDKVRNQFGVNRIAPSL